MKFGVLLESSMVSEWRALYVDYAELKRLLDGFVRGPEAVHNGANAASEAFESAASHTQLEAREWRRQIDDEEIDEREQAELRARFIEHGLVPRDHYEQQRQQRQRERRGTLQQLQRFEAELTSDSVPLLQAEALSAEDRMSSGSAHPQQQQQQQRPFYTKSIEEHSRHAKLCTAFLRRLESEVHKADNAYDQMVLRLRKTLATLFSHANQVLATPLDDADDAVDAMPTISSGSAIQKHEQSNRVNTLKAQFVDLFRQSNQLLNFALLNFQACKKITKKFKKISGTKSSDISACFELSNFAHHPELPSIMDETVKEFSRHFCGGDTTAGKIILLSRMTDLQFSRTDTFRLGLKFGICLSLIIWLITISFLRFPWFLNAHQEEIVSAFRPVYRAVFALLFLLYLWGILLYIWQRARINFVYIFEFEPSSRLTFFQVLDEASNLTIISLISFLIFVLDVGSASFISDSRSPFLAGSLNPRTLFVFLLAKLLLPSPLSSLWGSRRVLLSTLFHATIAPFGRLRFAEFFVADVLTSLVKSLSDVLAAFCNSVVWPSPTGLEFCRSAARVYVPIVYVLPLLLRFLQCLKRYWESGSRWPNLPNAGKYALGHAVVLFSALHPRLLQTGDSSGASSDREQTYRIAFVCAFITSTIFVSVWDVFVDWALDLTCSSNRERRPLLFNRRLLYVVAALINVVLRFFWTVSLIPLAANPFFVNAVGDGLYQNLLLPLIIVLEIFRRMMWACFRVEAEHIGHADDFRSHNIPVPLYFDNQREMERRKLHDHEHSRLGLVSELTLMVVVLVSLATIAAIVDRD